MISLTKEIPRISRDEQVSSYIPYLFLYNVLQKTSILSITATFLQYLKNSNKYRIG